MAFFPPTSAGLGEMVNEINNEQTRAQGVVQSARIEASKTDNQHQKLISDGKLIKINKSKKMLDTARRSRIQQIESYNSTIHPELNLVQINSNGPTVGNTVSSVTNKTSKSKQILGITNYQSISRQ